jgi:hypothetical protein
MNQLYSSTKGRHSMQCVCLSMSRIVVAALVVGCGTSTIHAQVSRLRSMPRPMTLVAPTTKPPTASGDAEKDKADAETRFPGGASLKTDRELERLLERASQFAAS